MLFENGVAQQQYYNIKHISMCDVKYTCTCAGGGGGGADFGFGLPALRYAENSILHVINTCRIQAQKTNYT